MARKVCPVTLLSAYCSSYSSVREMVPGTLLQLWVKALPPGQKEHEGMCVPSCLSLGLARCPCSMWAAQEVGRRAMPRSNARAGGEPNSAGAPGAHPTPPRGLAQEHGAPLRTARRELSVSPSCNCCPN